MECINATTIFAILNFPNIITSEKDKQSYTREFDNLKNGNRQILKLHTEIDKSEPEGVNEATVITH